MRIAMFVTDSHSLSVQHKAIYAPMEIHNRLAEGMARRGHQVTVFASRDSKLRGIKTFSAGLKPLDAFQMKYHPLWSPEQKIRQDIKLINLYEQRLLSEMYRQAEAGKFDVLHVHPIDVALPLANLARRVPTVATLHDPLLYHRKFHHALYAQLPNVHYVSISNNQRKPLPKLKYAATIYHGIDLKLYHFNPAPKNYVVFTGRFIQEKGVHLAIQAAKKASVPIQLAGRPAAGPYWDKKIKPRLGAGAKYLGFVPHEKIPDVYREARALLFPIQWEEAFGLVMIEAMACGTPVIAFNRGSVPEIVQHGKTGFVVKDVAAMAKAIQQLDKIDRAACRRMVERKFSLDHMLDQYEKLYARVARSHRKRA